MTSVVNTTPGISSTPLAITGIMLSMGLMMIGGGLLYAFVPWLAGAT